MKAAATAPGIAGRRHENGHPAIRDACSLAKAAEKARAET
jgi:hypothetical protein